MLSIRSFLVFTLCLFAFETVSATEFLVSQKTQKIRAWVPQGWRTVVDTYNTPLALLSQKGLQEMRSVIQVVPYGVKDSEDHFLKFKKDPDEFYSQKEKWLDGISGEMISHEPFVETSDHGSTVYSIGVKYKNDLGQFLDNTYYISSRTKNLYFVKAVLPLDQEEDFLPHVNRVIRSIANEN